MAVVKGCGSIGNLYDFDGMTELDKYSVYESIEWQMENGKDGRFIETTIEGGLEFNSTEKYIEKIRSII